MYETILIYLDGAFRGERIVVTVPRVGDHWGFADTGPVLVSAVQWRYDPVPADRQGPNDALRRPFAHVFCVNTSSIPSKSEH